MVNFFPCSIDSILLYMQKARLDDTEDYEVEGGAEGSGGDSDWSDLWKESRAKSGAHTTSSDSRPKRQRGNVQYFQEDDDEDDDIVISD